MKNMVENSGHFKCSSLAVLKQSKSTLLWDYLGKLISTVMIMMTADIYFVASLFDRSCW